MHGERSCNGDTTHTAALEGSGSHQTKMPNKATYAWFVGYHPRGPLSRGSPAETRRTYPRLAASRRLVRAFATVVALAHRKPVMAKPVMANPLIVVVAALLCILCVLR